MSGLYSFRNLAPEDLPMLRTWLATPEALRWWGDPGTELALIEEDLANEAMRQWIVSHDDRPFGYAQAYEVHAWPQPHLAELPQGAIAVDAFIGVPHMIGQGHGAGFLRLLAEELLDEGAPLIVIDPAPENSRARRVYQKAGFHDLREAETEGGPVILMAFSRG
jgi:aminoglycoside 6'-N-acetyltransferase